MAKEERAPAREALLNVQAAEQVSMIQLFVLKLQDTAAQRDATVHLFAQLLVDIRVLQQMLAVPAK